MTQADLVLVGGGLASATAAETLRLEGARGSIVIVAAEDALPYHRPPLATRVRRADEAPPPVLGQDFYDEHDVTVLRGTRALVLDLAGIHYRRTLDGAAAIRRTATKARRAVIVGGGFIGHEVAAALVERGIKVTLLAQGPVL